MPAATAVRAKVCMTCRIEKPACEFNTDRSRRDKLTPRCRDCNKAANRAYRESLNPQHDKTCARCGQGQPFSAFPVNPARPDGHGEWCTACHEAEARRIRTAITIRRIQRAQAAASRAAAAAEEARRAAYDTAEIGVAWQKRAACGPDSADEFFPDSQLPGTSDAARRICLRCPVADLCAADAAVSKQRTGVWAGSSREPRKRKQNAA